MIQFKIGDEVEYKRGSNADEFWGTVTGNGARAEDDTDTQVLWCDGGLTCEDSSRLKPRSRTLPKPIPVQPEAEAAFVALAKAMGYKVQKVNE